VRVSRRVVFIEPKRLLFIVIISVMILIRMHLIKMGAPMDPSILVVSILILLRLCVEVRFASADILSVILMAVLMSWTSWRIV
jgi:hypothetical protein